ncbi:hypothetical protein [Providencia manganoxydans]|uniref:hypothetical protein n=1 Tax=Providencia manganoxydans TaxID=2923283 RepID=UPI0034DD703F
MPKIGKLSTRLGFILFFVLYSFFILEFLNNIKINMLQTQKGTKNYGIGTKNYGNQGKKGQKIMIFTTKAKDGTFNYNVPVIHLWTDFNLVPNGDLCLN